MTPEPQEHVARPRRGLTGHQEPTPVLPDATTSVKGRLWNVCRVSLEAVRFSRYWAMCFYSVLF